MTPNIRIPTYDHITASRRYKPDWYVAKTSLSGSSDQSLSPLITASDLDGKRSASGPLKVPAGLSISSMLAKPEPRWPKTSYYDEACHEREGRHSRMTASARFLMDTDQRSEDSSDEAEEGTAEKIVDTRLRFSTSALQGSAAEFRPAVCRTPTDWRREWYQRHLGSWVDGEDRQGYSCASDSSNPASPSFETERDYLGGNRAISRGRDEHKHASDRVSTPWTSARRRLAARAADPEGT